MKADPINLILNRNINIDKSFYFISGNEITLMNKIKDLKQSVGKWIEADNEVTKKNLQDS